MSKESGPGPTVLGQQQAASQATRAMLTQAVMLIDVRVLSWPQTRLSAIFFFFQMQFFSNIAYEQLWCRDLGAREVHGKKKGKK